MSALTGVGPSIASGSHVWSGTCADLATAPPRRPSATSTASVEPSPSASGASAKTVVEVERADLLDEDEEREHEGRVADGVHDERLLAAATAVAPLVPVVDQEVRGEPDHAPAGEEEQQVPRHDEQEHGEDEERLVGVVAALLLVAVHVADRVDEDQEADPGDDEHHEDRERVDQDRRSDPEIAGGQPGPDASRPRSAPPGSRPSRSTKIATVQTKETSVAPEAIRPAPAAADALGEERDRDDRGGRREERDPGEDVHRQPLSEVSLSTSSSACLRDMATIRPRPRTASAAATTITVSAKIWPSPCRVLACEGDQREVAGVQHQLERQQDDQRAAADEDAEGAGGEEDDREDQVGGDPGAEPGLALLSRSASRRRGSPRRSRRPGA